MKSLQSIENQVVKPENGEKISLSWGCSGYHSYKNYTMLVAIANYSSNPVCRMDARLYVNNPDKRESIKTSSGSFMSAVISADFATAYKRADDSNRAALIYALANDEIEL